MSKINCRYKKNDEIREEAVTELKSVDVVIKKRVRDAIRILLEVGTGSTWLNIEFIHIVCWPTYIGINIHRITIRIFRRQYLSEVVEKQVRADLIAHLQNVFDTIAQDILTYPSGSILCAHHLLAEPHGPAQKGL